MGGVISDCKKGLVIAMLSIHSSPMGPLGTSDTGGMSVYIREVSRHLGQNGHRVDIFTLQAGEDQSLYTNVRLIHLTLEHTTRRHFKKEDIPSHFPQVFEALDRNRCRHGRDYDLIHSHYWLSGMVGAMAQTRWHRPHITMFHTLAKVKNNTASGENEPDGRIAREGWLAKTVDRMIVPTAREKQNLVRYYGAPPDHIGIIPCGVNLDLFKPRDGRSVRETLTIPAHAPMLLYVGRFAPLKGLDQLVAAAARLRRDPGANAAHTDKADPRAKAAPPDLHLVLVGGDGPTAPATVALQHLADSLEMTNRVHFAGRVDQEQLPSFYSAADLVVLPSHYESFGLVVLEAMACGTPVAATSVGVVDEVVREGINGTVIAGPDADSIVAAVNPMLHRLEQDRLSRKVIRETVTDFEWGHIARQTADTYAQVMDSHNPAQTSPFQECQTGIPL